MPYFSLCTHALPTHALSTHPTTYTDYKKLGLLFGVNRRTQHTGVGSFNDKLQKVYLTEYFLLDDYYIVIYGFCFKKYLEFQICDLPILSTHAFMMFVSKHIYHKCDSLFT